jgi:hypothetical protein
MKNGHVTDVPAVKRLGTEKTRQFGGSGPAAPSGNPAGQEEKPGLNANDKFKQSQHAKAVPVSKETGSGG